MEKTRGLQAVTNQRRHVKVVSTYFVVSLLVAATLAAAQPSGGATIPYREWYAGDGLGVNIMLNLQDDDSYSAPWDGCLGRCGRGLVTRCLIATRTTPRLQPHALREALTREALGEKE